MSKQAAKSGPDKIQGLFAKRVEQFEKARAGVDFDKARKNWTFVKGLFDNPDARAFLKSRGGISLVSVLGIVIDISIHEKIRVAHFDSLPKPKNVENQIKLGGLRALVRMDQDRFRKELESLLK